MLHIRDLVVTYGAATALDGVSLDVEAGEMVALVGPNGAGKTTTLNAISGVVPTASGTIEIDGRSAQVPEGRQMFADLSVDDNLRLGAWRMPRRDRNTDRIYDVIPDLVPLRRQRAGLLSGGQQQMVAIGRALMARPDVLLIDELSLGLAPLIAARLIEHLREVNRDEGTTILLVEQEVDLAFDLCSRAYVLEAGRVVAQGATEELRADPQLAAIYLGTAMTRSEKS
ncbi:MAG: ABC transporter ATP-binding protein [Pseudolysinimonas sp.]|uniref:ABC transporter ATP-binding protein n=1 Tax=Pseudolysinimonas sp. TaxID=2680009 RepID=UPI003C70BDFE